MRSVKQHLHHCLFTIAFPIDMEDRSAFLFAVLPATASADHAHLIHYNVHGFPVHGTSTPRIQDAIVTLLYRLSPAMLTKFLDPEIKDFRLTLNPILIPAGEGEEFVIMKRASKAIVSASRDSPFFTGLFSFNGHQACVTLFFLLLLPPKIASGISL
jgi:hypothetical protein